MDKSFVFCPLKEDFNVPELLPAKQLLEVDIERNLSIEAFENLPKQTQEQLSAQLEQYNNICSGLEEHIQSIDIPKPRPFTVKSLNRLPEAKVSVSNCIDTHPLANGNLDAFRRPIAQYSQ